MKSVLCFGDSNTWGYIPQSDQRLAWKQRWAGILQKQLGEEYQVIENGLCGRTTQYDSSSESFVNGLEEARICTEILDPLYIAIIMLGTNDCKELYHAKPGEIAKGVGRIGKLFRDKGAEILLIAPAPIANLAQSPFSDEFGNGAKEKSQRLKLYYEELAKDRGWGFLDAGSVVRTGAYDGIHLEQKEHEKLGVAVANKVKEMEVQYD